MRMKLTLSMLLLAASCAAQIIALNEFEVRKGKDLTAHVTSLADQVTHLNLAIDAEQDAKKKQALTDRRDKLTPQLTTATAAAQKWCTDVLASRKQDASKNTCDWNAGQIVNK